jgi:hypothetical protein
MAAAWVDDFMASTGFGADRAAAQRGTEKSFSSSAPRSSSGATAAATVGAGAFVGAFGAPPQSGARRVPGAVVAPPAGQVQDRLAAENAPVLPGKPLDYSRPFPMQALAVNKDGLQPTPRTRQRSWNAVGVGRADLAPTGPANEFAGENMAGVPERSSVPNLRSQRLTIPPRHWRERENVDINKSGDVNAGMSVGNVVNQTSADNKTPSSVSLIPWYGSVMIVICVVAAFASVYFLLNGQVAKGSASLFVAVVLAVVVYTIAKSAHDRYASAAALLTSSKSATVPARTAGFASAENAERAIGSGQNKWEPGVSGPSGWGAWPVLPSHYDMRSGALTTRPGRPTTRPGAPWDGDNGDGKDEDYGYEYGGREPPTRPHGGAHWPVRSGRYEVVPLRRDQPDPAPFRAPPDGPDDFASRLRAQGMSQAQIDAMEGPRAGVGYQREPLPEGRAGLPPPALMRAPENMNMSADDLREFMRRMNGEMPDQFYQAHPAMTFNADWEFRSQVDDDQKRFGLAGSPGQMNRKWPMQEPRIDQAGARTSHLKDPPPGAVPPLEKVHPWLERDESGEEPALVTPVASERAVARAAPAATGGIEIEELQEELRDPPGAARGPVGGPPPPIETMSDRKRRMMAPPATPAAPATPATLATQTVAPAAPAAGHSDSEAASAASPAQPAAAASGLQTQAADADFAPGDDEGAGAGGFLAAFAEKNTPTDEDIDTAIRLAGRRE